MEMMPFGSRPLPPLVLASTSRYRRALLDALGIDYAAEAPDYAELLDPAASPHELVMRHARGKALSLVGRFPDALVIGSDQGVAWRGALLGKPGTAERAVEQLLALAGHTHELLTAVAVVDAASGRSAEALCVHAMRMAPLRRDDAERYVALDQPLDCAGSYRVEGAGAALFEAMDGPDHTAIVGLPVTLVGRLVGELGYDWHARVFHAMAPRLDGGSGGAVQGGDAGDVR